MASSRFDLARVRAYYEANTAAFAAYGQGGGEGAIHRAVWGPGVATRGQAFHYVDDRIAAIVAALPAVDGGAVPHVVDLGCGVGATLCHLAGRVPLTGTGVTLSPTQAALARERIARLGLDDRLICIEGDYARVPAPVPAADVALAIESFVHAQDAAAFFAECARLVKPGGRLVICDDVLCAPAAPDARAARAVARFRAGWHLNTVITRAELCRLAGRAGFVHVETIDLTPWLELRRPRDRALALVEAPLAWLGRHSPRAASLAGGAALNRGLRRGWLAYELTTFRA